MVTGDVGGHGFDFGLEIATWPICVHDGVGISSAYLSYDDPLG